MSVEHYEVEIEKLPAALVGGYLAVRYAWTIWSLDDAGERKYRALFAPPLEGSGRSFTKWGARREARSVIRKSAVYYTQERKRVVITVERGAGYTRPPARRGDDA